MEVIGRIYVNSFIVALRGKRFRDIRFWVRGSSIVPGETEETRKMVRRVFKSLEKEEHLMHKQVVLLLHYQVGVI